MSWSDDMRCLYCDGKLPLYRKITHGQFCSTTHRKAYWQEQERLAVERLQQTHNSLRVHRPPTPVESILGRDPGEAELSGFVPAVLYPQSQGAPRMVVADPLAYELEQIPGKLEWTMPEGAAMSMPSAGLIRLLQEWSDAALGKNIAGSAAASPRGVEPVPKTATQAALRPSLELSPVSWTEDSAPAAAAAVGLTLAATAPSLRTISLQPLPARMPRPTQCLDLPIAPATPEMEPSVEPPAARRFFQLPRLQARPCALPAEAPRQILASEPAIAALPSALFPDRLVVKAVGFPVLAGAVRLLGIHTPRAQAPQPAHAAAGNVCALARAAKPEPVQAALALPARQLSLAMGKGSRYPIRLRASGAPGADASPMDFPRLPADVPPIPPAALAPAAALLDAVVPEARGLVPLTVNFGRLETKPIAPMVSNVATIPQPLRTEPIRPSSRLEPLDAKPAADLFQTEAGGMAAPGTPAWKAYPWSRAVGFWKLAPRDLKLLAFAIPLLAVLAFHRELPKVHFATTPPSTAGLRKNLRSVVNTQWTSVRRAVVDRAAVALDEDFRSGLDDWASRGDAHRRMVFRRHRLRAPGTAGAVSSVHGSDRLPDAVSGNDR